MAEEDLAATILALLDRRDRGATICPSEVARAVAGEQDESWRALMAPVRRAAVGLVADGALEVTQGGEVVDPASACGPIRLRLPVR